MYLIINILILVSFVCFNVCWMLVCLQHVGPSLCAVGLPVCGSLVPAKDKNSSEIFSFHWFPQTAACCSWHGSSEACLTVCLLELKNKSFFSVMFVDEAAQSDFDLWPPCRPAGGDVCGGRDSEGDGGSRRPPSLRRPQPHMWCHQQGAESPVMWAQFAFFDKLCV